MRRRLRSGRSNPQEKVERGSWTTELNENNLVKMRWAGLSLRTSSCLIPPCCLGYTAFGLGNKKAKVVVSRKVEASFRECRDERE